MHGSTTHLCHEIRSCSPCTFVRLHGSRSSWHWLLCPLSVFSHDDKISTEDHTTDNGVSTQGVCLTTASCGSMGGGSVPDHCPGAASIQCCLYPECTYPGYRPGYCMNSSKCAGYVCKNYHEITWLHVSAAITEASHPRNTYVASAPDLQIIR